MSEIPVQSRDAVKFISFDEDWRSAALPQISSYLSGNQRVLAHQGTDGALWALSTQVASLGEGREERSSLDDSDGVCFCNGIQGRRGPVCWYDIELENGTQVNTAGPNCGHKTGYYRGVFPHTSLSAGSLRITISTVAPIEREEGSIHRPAAIVYRIEMENTGTHAESGRVALRIAGETYAVRGGADQWYSRPRSVQWDQDNGIVVIRSQDLPDIVLSAEEPATVETQQGLALVKRFELAPGETWSSHVWVAITFNAGTGQASAVSTLGKISAAQWIVSTVEYWKSVLGAISISPRTRLSDFLPRAAQECLYCIRVNEVGEVVGVVPSPTPLAETPSFSDILFVSMPALYLKPELYSKIITWYAQCYTESYENHPLDTQARVIPAIMAGLLHRIAGGTAFLSAMPQTVANIERLLESVADLRDVTSGLFPTELMHGYKPLIQYELGTNIECWAAFELWGQVLDALGMGRQATRWSTLAQESRESIRQCFATRGPGKADWHYGGLRLVADYRLDPLHYYEHDALDIAIAPFLGFCTEQHRPWLNTMEHMFSPLYQLVKSRPTTAVWWEPANVEERREKRSAPGVVTRLASVQTDDDLDRAIVALERAIDVNGVLWVRSGDGQDRVMRSGREMGAAYGILMQRILGMGVDAAEGRITFAPRTRWRAIHCENPTTAAIPVSVSYTRGQGRAQSSVTNNTTRTWALRLGFRFPKSFQLLRLWLDGKPYAGEVIIQEDDHSKVFLLRCDLLPCGRVAAAIEVKKTQPPSFDEVASVA